MIYKDIVFDDTTKLYVNLLPVPSSGVHRMKFYVLQDNRLINITRIIANELEIDLDKNSFIRVGSGNMNMVFDTLYRFASRIMDYKDAINQRWLEHYYYL
jgi:hypothetical protein